MGSPPPNFWNPLCPDHGYWNPHTLAGSQYEPERQGVYNYSTVIPPLLHNASLLSLSLKNCKISCQQEQEPPLLFISFSWSRILKNCTWRQRRGWDSREGVKHLLRYLPFSAPWTHLIFHSLQFRKKPYTWNHDGTNTQDTFPLFANPKSKE